MEKTEIIQIVANFIVFIIGLLIKSPIKKKNGMEN